MRSIELRLDSIEARSVGSGKLPSSSMFSTVLPASIRSSAMRWFKSRRKYSASVKFNLHPPRAQHSNVGDYREQLININCGGSANSPPSDDRIPRPTRLAPDGQ